MRAKVLDLRAIAWSKHQLTDGAIPSGALAMIGHKMANPDPAAVELVAVGLWVRTKTGYGFPRWLKSRAARSRAVRRRAFATAAKIVGERRTAAVRYAGRQPTTNRDNLSRLPTAGTVRPTSTRCCRNSRLRSRRLTH